MNIDRYRDKRKKYNVIATLFVLWIGLTASCGSLRKGSVHTDHARPGGDRYAVVLSLDGFRADYLSKANTPVFDSIKRVGISGSLQPSFPSLTFPNHYSMATGLYPDHHGLVANEFYDDEYGHYTIPNRKAVENPGFYGGEPVWNTARRQGVQTASFFWVGSETAINGHHPHRWKKFDSKVPYTSRADSVLAWLDLPEADRPHLIMWYIEEPDHLGHHFTPEGKEVFAMVEKLDSVVGYFLNRLNTLPVGNKVDFLIVSDHGMETYYPERSVNLSDYMPIDSFIHVATGAFAHLYPKASYTDSAYRILQTVLHIKVYKKDEMPARFHYGSNKRIGELLILPDEGAMVYFDPAIKTFKKGGAHGYDNERASMQALFLGVGPHLKKGFFLSRSIPNIAVYPLICWLLNIKPSANDADLSDVQPFLRSQP